MNTILDKAASIVDADREKTYGKPDKNLRAIDRVEGRDAALSRRVPSHDGLAG